MEKIESIIYFSADNVQNFNSKDNTIDGQLKVFKLRSKLILS